MLVNFAVNFLNLTFLDVMESILLMLTPAYPSPALVLSFFYLPDSFFLKVFVTTLPIFVSFTAFPSNIIWILTSSDKLSGSLHYFTSLPWTRERCPTGKSNCPLFSINVNIILCWVPPLHEYIGFKNQKYYLSRPKLYKTWNAFRNCNKNWWLSKLHEYHLPWVKIKAIILWSMHKTFSFNQ